MEEAQKRFSEITTVNPPASEPKQKKPTRKTVKALIPKS